MIIKKYFSRMQSYCSEKKILFYKKTEIISGSDVPFQSILTEFQYRWNQATYRKVLIFRFAIFITIFLFFFIMNVFPKFDMFILKDYITIYDAFHVMFEAMNKSFLFSPFKCSIATFLASFLMDVMVGISWVRWLAFGDTLRFPLATSCFFALRGIIRTITILPMPPNYIWTIPTFNGIAIPSVTVSYQKADDFFFSGHIGCGVICVSESLHDSSWILASFFTFVTFFEIVVMLITRAHYSIDMITGAIVASWIYMSCLHIEPYVQQFLGLPFRPILPDKNVQMKSEPLL